MEWADKLLETLAGQDAAFIILTILLLALYRIRMRWMDEVVPMLRDLLVAQQAYHEKSLMRQGDLASELLVEETKTGAKVDRIEAELSKLGDLTKESRDAFIALREALRERPP